MRLAFKKLKTYFVLLTFISLMLSFLPSLCLTKITGGNCCDGCCEQMKTSASQIAQPACCKMNSASSSGSLPMMVPSHISVSQELLPIPVTWVLPVTTLNFIPKEIFSKAGPPSPPLFLTLASFLC